jgi:hypothetical protein
VDPWEVDSGSKVNNRYNEKKLEAQGMESTSSMYAKTNTLLSCRGAPLSIHSFLVRTSQEMSIKIFERVVRARNSFSNIWDVLREKSRVGMSDDQFLFLSLD